MDFDKEQQALLEAQASKEQLEAAPVETKKGAKGAPIPVEEVEPEQILENTSEQDILKPGLYSDDNKKLKSLAQVR